jgi:hypothetical protein
VKSPRETTAQEMEIAIKVMRDVRLQLRTTENAYRRAMKSLASGALVADTLESITAATTRLSLNDMLADLEHSRHRARLAMIAAGLEEGMSIGQLGRALGFSRQLAARYAREAREHS